MVEVDIFSDLDSLKLTTEQQVEIAASKRRLRTPQTARQRGAFIRGPFPMPQVMLAGALPGKALLVWLLVQHQVRMTRKLEVSLPGKLLDAARIDRFAKSRALRDLEQAGLIQVDRQPGQMPRISLVQVEGDAPTDSTG